MNFVIIQTDFMTDSVYKLVIVRTSEDIPQICKNQKKRVLHICVVGYFCEVLYADYGV